MWSLVCQASQAADWKGLMVVALQQVPVGRVEAAGRRITVGSSHEKGQPKDIEEHHIASNMCLLGNWRHHDVEYLWETESKYQIDSAFEQ